MDHTGRTLGLGFKVALVAVALAAGGCHGKYIRAVSGEKIEATPERLARGGYLVNQVSSCGVCHTTRNGGDIALEGERADAFLGGGNTMNAPGMGTLWIPNVTPDVETGIGAWSDDEVLRALRDGVSRDGHFLLPLMPYDSYQHMSDEDARSVVAYLRSVPSFKQPKPRAENQVGMMGKVLFKVIGVQMHAPTANVPPPDKSSQVEYGRYIATLGVCSVCHAMGDKGPLKPDDPLFMAGGSKPFDIPTLGKIYARNLTPDPDTGLGKYRPEQIKQAIRAGLRLDGKRMAPPMALMIPHYSGMSDEDLDALVAYLKSLKPVKREVPPRELTEEGKKLVGE